MEATFAAQMERARIAKWGPVVAAILLLATTAMPALVRMRCVNSGHTTTSIGQVAGCCSEHGHEGEGPVVHATCCEVDRTAPDHAAFTLRASFPIPAALAVEDTHELVTRLSLCSAGASYRLTSRPPPRSTPQRLSLSGSYLL